MGVNANANANDWKEFEIITNFDEKCFANEKEDIKNCPHKVWHRIDNLRLFHQRASLLKWQIINDGRSFKTLERCLRICLLSLQYLNDTYYWEQCTAAAITKDNPNGCVTYNRNASQYTSSEIGSTAYFIKCCIVKANATEDNDDKSTKLVTTPEKKRVTAESTEYVTKEQKEPQSPELTIGIPADHTDSTTSYDKKEKSESTSDEQIKNQQTTYEKEKQENISSTYDQEIVTKLTENISIKQESTIAVPNNANSTYEEKRDTESTTDEQLKYQQTTYEKEEKENVSSSYSQETFPKLTKNVSIKQESTMGVANIANSTYEEKKDTESTDEQLKFQQTTNEQSKNST